MSLPILLHGALASHHRGRVLQEAIDAHPAPKLPTEPCILLAFADEFQALSDTQQAQLVDWTRPVGRVLLLLPPFSAAPCRVPVAWQARRRAGAPRGGEGLAELLAAEVSHELDGDLQTPTLQGATWSDLSRCIGTYRTHPAAGLFAVSCLPLWSLSVLDSSRAALEWLNALTTLAGTPGKAPPPQTLPPMGRDHYGLLVFLLSGDFGDAGQALASLQQSSVMHFAPAHAELLMQELQARGLVSAAAAPTPHARELVMRSPWAPFVNALREEST